MHIMKDHHNLLDSPGKSLKDTLHIATLLHGDDPQLILLVHPHEEGLLLVVVDAPALGPVSLHAGGDQVLVPGNKEEVIVDQLLPDSLIHASEGEVGAGQVILKLGKSVDHQLLLFKTLLLGDAGGEPEAFNAATDTDPDRLDRDVFVDVSLDLVDVHVAGVGGISADSMVLLDQWVKDLGKVLVGVLVPSIDAAVLIVVLDGASNSLGQGEPRCCSLVPRQLDG